MRDVRLPFADGVGTPPLNRRRLAATAGVAAGCVLLLVWALGLMGAGAGGLGSANGQGDSAADASVTVRRGDSGSTFANGDPDLASAEPGAALEHAQLVLTLQRAGWPTSLHTKALAVAGCESGWNPTAVGHVGERGLFQIHPVHDWRFTLRFGEEADPFNPHQNASVAFDIWTRFGWEPWSCQDAGE